MSDVKKDKLSFGYDGEKIAYDYLEKNNYYIIRKNYRCSYGEIDIIAYDKNEIVFIEVKTRKSTFYGEARESVDLYKKKHIRKSAEFFIMKNKLENFYIRFDVIEVYMRNKIYNINHIKNIII